MKFGGDTAPLEQALKDTNKEISKTQKELNEVNKLLKLDPTNTDLLKQKQKLLGDQIGSTKTKLDALKQAQAQLDAEMKKGGNVNQEEYRKLQREIASTEASLKKLNDESKKTNPNLVKLGEALKTAGDMTGKFAKGVVDLTVNGIKVLGTTSLATATAVFKLAQNSGALADDLNTLASTTGLSTEELQEFQYASDLIDVSVETLAGALKKTTASMISAQSGTGKSAEAFKTLGVAITNADGSLRDNNDVFNDSIKALSNIANETERDALAMQIFGKSATELNPLIEGGADALQEMSKQANELGLIMSQDLLDKANAFNDQLDILKANGQGIFQRIGMEVASELTEPMQKLNEITMSYIKELTTAMDENGIEGLLTKAGGIIGDIASKITEGLPKIAKIGTSIVIELVNSIKQSATQIGTAGGELIQTLVEGLYELLPSLIETAILFITSFTETLGNNMPTILDAVVEGLMNIADVIVNNIDLIINSAVTLFLGLVQGLERALPKLIAKLPEIIQKVVATIIDNLPLIIEAVGTIIIAIVDTIGQSANDLVPAIIECITALLDTIIDNLPTILETIITVILAIVDALVDNIELLIDAGFKLIVGLGEGLIKAIPKLVEKLPEIIGAIVNGLIGLLSRLLEVGKKLIETLGQGIGNAISNLGEAISNIWNYIRDTISEKFKGIVSIGKNLIEGLWNGIKNAKDWLINKIKQICDDALRSNQELLWN